MQILVNTLTSKQVMPIVALVSPTFGSSQISRNQLIQEYNQVIRWELPGIEVGPDLYSFFINYPNLFADDGLHPNGLGHKSIAILWYNSILNKNLEPFVLQNLSPTNYKQNLLEIGNNYYIDMTYTLSSVPSELIADDIVWIMTADSDRNNTGENYLSFDIIEDSTIYVGYDSRALFPPDWLASNFTLLAVSIGVTDPDVGSLDLYQYQADLVNGTVILGGNKAAGASFPDGIEAANYVVIVKKRTN